MGWISAKLRSGPQARDQLQMSNVNFQMCQLFFGELGLNLVYFGNVKKGGVQQFFAVSGAAIQKEKVIVMIFPQQAKF